MLKDILKSITKPILGPLLDKIPDPNERRRLESQAEENLLNAVTGVVMAQIDVNKTEAKHGSIFVAGWRPAVGWVCASALAWNFILQPLISWAAFLFGVDIGDAPKLDTGELMTVLLGMLGLSGMRTYEKKAGVARRELANGETK